MENRRVYITYKEQEWTFYSKDDLKPLLNGEDDYILEFYVESEDFAIILKNGRTFDVRNSAEEAQEYVKQIYKNYEMVQNTGTRNYLSRSNPQAAYRSAGEAQIDGEYDYIFVPTGHYYLTKFGKIIAGAPTEEAIEQKMFQLSGATYSVLA